MSVGKVYVKTATPNDHIVIPNVRTAYRQKFNAGPEWTEVRVGMFLSLTANDDDDDPDGLAETISNGNSPFDAYWIGLKSDGDDFPLNGAPSFVGFTNAVGIPPLWRDPGDSILVSSDIGVGTSNAYYWRATTTARPSFPHGFCGLILLNYTQQEFQPSGYEQHFVQDPSNAGGYCGCFAFRLRRSAPNSNIITVDVKANDVNSCDFGFSNSPTADALLALLESWPGSTRTMAAFNFTGGVPNSFFVYWPFTMSRIRIHSRGFVRFR